MQGNPQSVLWLPHRETSDPSHSRLRDTMRPRLMQECT